jgi:hypothetical protein
MTEKRVSIGMSTIEGAYRSSPSPKGKSSRMMRAFGYKNIM